MASCSLQKLLADLGVNVILVTTLAKHCSYIYNLNSLLFENWNFEFSKGGQNVFKGGRFAPPAPPKRNPTWQCTGGMGLLCTLVCGPGCLLYQSSHDSSSLQQMVTKGGIDYMASCIDAHDNTSRSQRLDNALFSALFLHDMMICP